MERLDEAQRMELDQFMPHAGCLIYLPYRDSRKVRPATDKETIGFFGRVNNLALPTRAVVGGFPIELTPHQSFLNEQYCWGTLEYNFDKKNYAFEQGGTQREILKCLMGLDNIERLSMAESNAAFNNFIRQLLKRI